MKILAVCLFLSLRVTNGDADVTETIENQVMKYFDSENQKAFYRKWQKYKEPIDNVIQLTLKETFGEQSMNVYIRKTPNSFRLTKGFLVNDNVAYVLFKDLYLSRFPRLRTPKVSLELSTHVLRVDADVSRIVLDADYLVFRNLTDVVKGPFDPYKTSPFAMEQVEREGQAAIVMEGCSLSGFAVASLHGQSVHVSHDDFRLVNCNVNVEISSHEFDLPPVISPYFSQLQGIGIECLLLTVIKEELMPKLQGALFSYVNTSAIFDEDLPRLRQHQQAIFKRTLAFMARLVKYLNLLIARETSGRVEEFNNFMFSSTDKYYGSLQDTRVRITNVSVSGLDSVYSAQTGGPFKELDTSIADTIRLAAVQVIGNIEVEIDDSKSIDAFYGEVQDVTIYVSMDVQTSKHTITVVGWRNAEIHAPNCYLCAHDPKAIINGFLLNELPKFVEKQVSKHFAHAMKLAGETGDFDTLKNPNEKDTSDENYDVIGSDGNIDKSQNEEYSANEDGNGNEDDVGVVAHSDVTQEDHTAKRDDDRSNVPDSKYDNSSLNNDKQDQETDKFEEENASGEENSSDQIEETAEENSNDENDSDYRRRNNIVKFIENVSSQSHNAQLTDNEIHSE